MIFPEIALASPRNDNSSFSNLLIHGTHFPDKPHFPFNTFKLNDKRIGDAINCSYGISGKKPQLI
jgi:hypothetical protein